MNANNGNENQSKQNQTPDQGKDKGALEKLASLIDPPSRETSDDELIDPGNSIPNKPLDSDQKPSGTGSR